MCRFDKGMHGNKNYHFSAISFEIVCTVCKLSELQSQYDVYIVGGIELRTFALLYKQRMLIPLVMKK